MQCLLDMDGVLVNFVKGVCKAHGRSDPYQEEGNLGRFEIDKIWGMDGPTFWTPLDYHFWTNLEPMPDYQEILEIVFGVFGVQNVCILSSPCKNTGCMDGKMHWLNKYIPLLSRQYLFGPAKQFCTGSDRILIDDYEKNVDAFGNGAILLPRPWNYRFGWNTIKALRDLLPHQKVPPVIHCPKCRGNNIISECGSNGFRTCGTCQYSWQMGVNGP